MNKHGQLATEPWVVLFWQFRDAANAKAKANLQFEVFNYEVEGHNVRGPALANCRDIHVDEQLVVDKATIKSISIKSLSGLQAFIGDKDWTKGAKRRRTQVR